MCAELELKFLLKFGRVDSYEGLPDSNSSQTRLKVHHKREISLTHSRVYKGARNIYCVYTQCIRFNHTLPQLSLCPQCMCSVYLHVDRTVDTRCSVFKPLQTRPFPSLHISMYFATCLFKFLGDSNSYGL